MELTHAKAVYLHKQNETENPAIVSHSCHARQQLWLDLRTNVEGVMSTQQPQCESESERHARKYVFEFDLGMDDRATLG